jgi:hypothetical protein
MDNQLMVLRRAPKHGALVCLLCACGPRIVCERDDDVAAALRALDAAADVYGWTGSAEVLCMSAQRAQVSCLISEEQLPLLEGCAPHPGHAIVVDGHDVCRVVVHEAAHWVDPDCKEDQQCWPAAAEMEGKAQCASMALAQGFWAPPPLP